MPERRYAAAVAGKDTRGSQPHQGESTRTAPVEERPALPRLVLQARGTIARQWQRSGSTSDLSTQAAMALYGAGMLQLPHNRHLMLTQQQREVLIGAARGETAADTGRRLGRSEDTIKSHRAIAYKRLGANGATQAVALAMAAGLIRFEHVAPLVPAEGVAP